MQGAAAPSVPQVLSGTRYVAANTSVVTPIASGCTPLPSAYLDGYATVTGVDIASAYNVYLVGQDNYTNPNTMTAVRSCFQYHSLQDIVFDGVLQRQAFAGAALLSES